MNFSSFVFGEKYFYSSFYELHPDHCEGSIT